MINSISDYKNVTNRDYNRYQFFFDCIIISLLVAPAVFLSSEDDRNNMLVFCMMVGAVTFPFLHIRLYSKLIPLICVFIGMVVFQIVFHLSTFRISTILFSLLFIIYYIIGVNILHKGDINLWSYSKILKRIILAYFIVLLLQQLCVILSLPIFLGNNLSANPWKLNSLSAEPSHTARLLGLAMYSFLTIQSANERSYSLSKSMRLSPIVWSIFLYTMITTVSGTAFLVLGLILLRFISKRNMLICFGGICLLGIVFISSNFSAFSRVFNFFSAAITLSASNMMEADHSASVRIVPAILCFERINLLSLDGWIGTGIDTTSKWMSSEFYGVPEGFSGGEMIKFTLEYGVIVGSVFLWWTFKICYDPHHKISSIGFWIICVLLQSFNSQQLWCCLFLMTSNKYLLQKNLITTLYRNRYGQYN